MWAFLVKLGVEQHAIPQQVTSYEFKLVGDMTLKQFLKAAGGIVLAVLINTSGIVFFIKWPLMILAGGGGLALAFLPYQDRPLETWLVSFIRSIYSPTIYTYKKKSKINWLDIDLSKKINTKEDDQPLPISNTAKQNKIGEFVASLPKIKISNINLSEEIGGTEEETVKKPVDDSTILVDGKVKTDTKEEVLNRLKEQEKNAPIKREIDWRTQATDVNVEKEKAVATKDAVFGEMPIPVAMKEPNVIIGMVTDNTGKIIEEAIVEIQDTNGNPIRVLKTNSIGQFKSSTQMASGKYIVIVEKDGYKFENLAIELKGEIVPPIKITAR